MRVTSFGLLLSAAALSWNGSAPAAPPRSPLPADPLPLGHVSRGVVRVCFFDGKTRLPEGGIREIAIDSAPTQPGRENDALGGNFPLTTMQYCPDYHYPFRASYGFGQLWLLRGLANPGRFRVFEVRRFPEGLTVPRRGPKAGLGEFPELARMGKDKPFALDRYWLDRARPLDDPITDMERPHDPPAKLLPSPVQWDAVPVGATRVHLVLTNSREGTVEVHEYDLNRGAPEAKTRWVRLESFRRRFCEGFRAFGRGEDLYFATETGKLLLARKVREGRAWRVLWDDPDRRISAVLVDDDRGGRVFLAGRARGTGRPFLVEMADPPRPYSFAAGAIRPLRLAGPLKGLAEFAQLLPLLK